MTPQQRGALLRARERLGLAVELISDDPAGYPRSLGYLEATADAVCGVLDRVLASDAADAAEREASP